VSTATTDRFRALFEPRGVLIAGASTHPGKFGFVSLHNLLAAGYEGKVFGTNRDGAEVLGVQTVADVADLPDGEIDLVFVCTPAGANPDLLRACAKKGITAAFIASAGYGEAGEEGRQAQADLVALADELGILLAGPNGQGVVSPPAKLCAQIVAPYPPRGHIAIASQSGNFVSSFENYARLTGVGVSRAVSAGNAAAVGVADYLEYFTDDPETRVSLAYVESVDDGRAFYDRLRALAERAVQGRGDGRRPAGRRQPHRRAGQRRHRVRRHGPPGRGHPGGERRAGIRAGRHVRLPAAAQGRPGGGRDHGRRVGRGDGRRPGRQHAGVGPAARRPARRHRPGAPAPVEPQQPDRHGRG
jgi:succinyl-CoA synthetase alpha subunit